MTKKIEARLAAVERKLNAKRHPTDKAFRILFVEGGLPGPISWAYAGTLRWKREANENGERTPLAKAGYAYSHIFKDPGPPIVEADYQPVTLQKDPEQILALIFARLGRDYGGSWADYREVTSGLRKLR